MLYAVSESFEAYAGIMNKVLGDFVFVQPTAVTVVETLREVPVIQSLRHEVGEFHGLTRGTLRMYCTHHEGDDPVGDELVNKVRIELDPLWVGGVITTAQWDDAWPRDGEPVSLHAILAQQGDVVLPAFV